MRTREQTAHAIPLDLAQRAVRAAQVKSANLRRSAN